MGGSFGILSCAFAVAAILGDPLFSSAAWPGKAISAQAQKTAEGEDANMAPDFLSDKSAKDLEITRRVQREIRKDNSVTSNIRKIRVTTTNGNVTLQGSVNSMSDKEKIGLIAKSAAGWSSRINNLIQVKNNASSSLGPLHAYCDRKELKPLNERAKYGHAKQRLL